MTTHHELAPVPLVDSELGEPLMSISETAAILDLSLADVVDLACRQVEPLPIVYDETGSIGFYRSEVDCWCIEQGFLWVGAET